ncbi:uncharacterized protein (TIGR03083 family) [Kutzneria viridogrisea]|uniref:Uncharacterized protein (TIGR03083 family) n=1 Tax=Kutzneria viridogrisea TaxID=47990 RepID=A0ABR6BXR9_9PSEU|nr:uncharacterized protein (TIGR03083 family) [Kutzneria viridogrisea]
MDHLQLVAKLTEQAEAMRAAVRQTGPDAPVPTCPEWTVRDLVEHTAKVHGWALTAVTSGDTSQRPPFPDSVPSDWSELLTHWQGVTEQLAGELTKADPDTPTWAFNGVNGKVGFWSRRQAHETAIHRLDAEAALAQGTALPPLVFDPEMAADGVDEYLSVLAPILSQRKPGGVQIDGRVLYHAADAGRTWQVTLTAGSPAVVGPAPGSGTDVDVTVAGTADALYRAVWGRPSNAIITGEAELLKALAP